MLDPFFEEAEKDIQRRITNCMTLTSGNHESPGAHYSCYKLGLAFFPFFVLLSLWIIIRYPFFLYFIYLFG